MEHGLHSLLRKMGYTLNYNIKHPCSQIANPQLQAPTFQLYIQSPIQLAPQPAKHVNRKKQKKQTTNSNTNKAQRPSLTLPRSHKCVDVCGLRILGFLECWSLGFVMNFVIWKACTVVHCNTVQPDGSTPTACVKALLVMKWTRTTNIIITPRP